MTRSTRRACLLCSIILALAATATADPEIDPAMEGLPIVAIHVDRKDIFDTSNPKTKAWFYRWANALHIVSKEDFIRSMLLFKEGDPYSASLAAESARILRGLGIMNPVKITAHHVDGGVDVMVETHDQWTLKLGGKLGVFGSNASYQADFEEENLLGWGKAVSVGYESDNERNTWSLGYFDPNVFNSRWRVNLVHATYSDGFHDEVVIDRPFYSLTTPWTWGVSGLRQELTNHLYSRSESVVDGLHESEKASAWGGHGCPEAASLLDAFSPAGSTARIGTLTGFGTRPTRPTQHRRTVSSAVLVSPMSRWSIASLSSRASGRGRSRRTYRSGPTSA